MEFMKKGRIQKSMRPFFIYKEEIIGTSLTARK